MATNSTSYYSYYGTDGDDYITNSGKYATINAYAGNDTVNNYAGGAVVLGGDGNDTIYSSVTSTINGGYGYVTLSGGYGADSIRSLDGHISVSGGSGADTIQIGGSFNPGYNTVNGGWGNDVISLAGGHNVIQFDYLDDYDMIYGIADTDTIAITGASSFSTVASGSNVIVSAGSYAKATVVGGASKSFKVTPAPTGSTVSPYYPTTSSGSITNSNSYSVVSGSSYADTITNNGTYSTIIASGGNDTIRNRAQGSFIQGGDGNDSIYSSVTYGSYRDVTIDGGAGNDYISSNDARTSLSGGSGNDTITSGSWSYVTVNGGTGDDRISLASGHSNNLIQYTAGDGYDTIYGISSSDTISFADGNISTVQSGNDYYIYNGSGGVIVKDGASSSFTITPSPDYDTVTLPSSTPSGIIWMDIQYPNAKNVDARNTSAVLGIAGNAKSNSIAAGSGGDILWGGSGSEADTLVGGNGSDTFLYFYGNGNDVCSNVSSSDTVWLSNLSLSQISSINTTSNSVTLGFNNGQQLKVNDTGVSTKFYFEAEGGATAKFTHNSGPLGGYWSL